MDSRAIRNYITKNSKKVGIILLVKKEPIFINFKRVSQ